MAGRIKVSSRLRLTIAMLVVTVATTGVVLSYAWGTVRDAIASSKAAAAAVQHVLELNQLTAEYEFRPNSRPVQQWREVFQSLNKTIDELDLRRTTEADDALHDRLRHNSKDANELFERWVASRMDGTIAASGSETSRLLADSIMLRLRSMQSVAQRLLRQADDTSATQMFRLGIVSAVGVVLIALSITSLILVNRRMLDSLDKLGAALESIGDGSKVLHIGIDGADEFARLASTLEDISGRLSDSRKTLAATNDQLQQEVKDRRVAEGRLKSAIDTLESGFAYFDAEDRLVIYNDGFLDPGMREAYETPLGHTFEFLVKNFSQQYLTAMDALGDREKWLNWRVEKHQNPPDQPWEIQWSDGTWFMVYERRTPDGGTVGLWTNITEQKRREKELQEARAQSDLQAYQLSELAKSLEDANADVMRASMEKSRFLASMSHELRTPLTSIIGFSDIIKTEMHGPINPPSYASYIGMISESGAHLLSLINDVLDISKIEAGRMALQPDVLSIQEVCHQAIGLTRELAAKKEVKLASSIQPGCELLHGDQRAVKQILLNLISNSIKFTEAGGSVHLAATFDRSGAMLTVSDTGIGMTPQEITKALEPYGQVDSSLARKSIGTGLGLPLAKSLAELHGGSLHVESEKGKGTTIIASLPWLDVLGGAPQLATMSGEPSDSDLRSASMR